jgi:hypothetical protein
MANTGDSITMGRDSITMGREQAQLLRDIQGLQAIEKDLFSKLIVNSRRIYTYGGRLLALGRCTGEDSKPERESQPVADMCP